MGRLGSALILTVVGSLLSWIPVIGIIGELIALAGFVYLVLAWRSLSKSDLPSAESYKVTYQVLIVFYVLGILATIIGVFAAFGATVSTGSVTVFIGDYAVALVVGGVLSFVGFFRSAFSLRRLSGEVSEKRLDTSGKLFIVAYLISLATLIVFGSVLASGALNNEITTLVASGASQVGALSLMFTGNLVFVGIAFVAGLLLAITAGVIGSRGASKVFWNMKMYGAPQTPQPVGLDSRKPLEHRCQSCGALVLAEKSTYCYNCGAKLLAQ